jgi:outer membrane lipoprotein-sorting protein
MRAFHLDNKKKLFCWVAAFVTLTSHAVQADGPSASQLIPEIVSRYERLYDYTCKLDKEVCKKGVLYQDAAILVKYKKPKHYYFRWQQGPARGREVIYVDGRNQNQLVAHPGGVLRFLTLHLDPRGHLAMKANRHSLQHSGMEKIVELMASNYDLALKLGIDAIHCTGRSRFDGRDAWVIEGAFPPNEGFYAHRIILWVDRTIGLPVKIVIFDKSDRLVEAYAFRDLKVNVGLTEEDFNPANPEYHYSWNLKR